MDSPLRSPLRESGNQIPPPPPNTPEKPASPALPVPMVFRSTWEDLAMITKVDTANGAEGGGAGGGGTTAAARAGERGFRAVSGIARSSRRVATARRAAIGVRVSAMVFCLVSFSVMAADKNKGWALDSFDRYMEYRYCLSVNVIAFAYSGFQVYAQINHMMKGKHVIRRPIGYYFDFFMDQILAYLLMSASSSAATRTEEWVSNWGSDKFPKMANGSVAISFLAFMALAVSSLISAYNLFSWNS